jgi:hypothetical protein
VEINSHSLFSKWFSESGKLVMKMFQKIDEFMDDEDSLVCLLIGASVDHLPILGGPEIPSESATERSAGNTTYAGTFSILHV